MQEITLRYKGSKDPYRPGGERKNRLEYVMVFFNRKGLICLRDLLTLSVA